MSDEDIWPGENLSPILLPPVDWKAIHEARRCTPPSDTPVVEVESLMHYGDEDQ